MNKVIVMSDSTCDLGYLAIEKDVKVVPLHITFQGDERDYLDGENIIPDEIYKKVEEGCDIPKTGAISIGEFIEEFKKYINEGYDIIYAGIGSKLSGCFQNATIASREFEEGRIEIVDSKSLSTGTGLLIMKMCELRDKGLGVHEIADKIRSLVPYVVAQFCIDRLDYLYKGGRCSGMKKVFVHALSIHPVAKMMDGDLKVYKLPRGKYVKAVDEQIKDFERDLPNMDKSCVFITHSGRIEGMDEYAYEIVKKYIEPENIHITRAGSIVSTHCGPKTIGILYIKSE